MFRQLRIDGEAKDYAAIVDGAFREYVAWLACRVCLDMTHPMNCRIENQISAEQLKTIFLKIRVEMMGGRNMTNLDRMSESTQANANSRRRRFNGILFALTFMHSLLAIAVEVNPIITPAEGFIDYKWAYTTVSCNNPPPLPSCIYGTKQISPYIPFLATNWISYVCNTLAPGTVFDGYSFCVYPGPGTRVLYLMSSVGSRQGVTCPEGVTGPAGVISGSSCISCPAQPSGLTPILSGSNWKCSNSVQKLSKTLGTCTICQQYARTDPINSGTGNKIQPEFDYVGNGVYPLIGERFYNSNGASPIAGPTGNGGVWYWFYDRSLSLTSNSSLSVVTLKRSDGKQLTFSLLNNAWVGDVDVNGKLVQSADSSGQTIWRYTNEQDEVEIYNYAGRLQSITNRYGLTQTLAYSSTNSGGFVLDSSGAPTSVPLPVGMLIRVTDPFGRSLQFGYEAMNRVVKMTDPAGAIYLYSYVDNSADAPLNSVTYPDGRKRTYLYGEIANTSSNPATFSRCNSTTGTGYVYPVSGASVINLYCGDRDVPSSPYITTSYAHALTGILDENGTRYASWTYDAAGRATSSELGAFGSGIDHVGLVYTNPDANGNSTTSVTDVMGQKRSYTFSTLLGVVKNTGITGQPCNGCSQNFTYDANGNVASRTDFNGNVTQYSYDFPRNLEVSRIEAFGTPQARTISTQWNSAYRLPAAVAEPLRITRYTYDAQGNLLSRSLQTTSDTNGSAGFNATPVDSPRVTTYTYNTAGQVLTIDGPRTDVTDITSYTYDTQGNLISVTNALNQTTSLGSYDANGRAGTLTTPNGLVTSLTYDLRGRLTSRVSGGETTTYTYDGVGNLTGVTLPSGASYTYTYDQAHRLIQIADSANNKLIYTLDAAGNRTKEQLFDSSGTLVQTHSRVFDALNRLVQDIGAVNQTTVYTYDAVGNLKTVTDPLNHQTVNTYDALNRLSQVSNPDGGLIQYGYDGQDQLTQVTDPNNLITRYTRDGLGQLTAQQSPDTGTTNLSYDSAGNVLSRTDAKGQSASYSYDALNRISGISYAGHPELAVSYQYDQGVNGIGHLTGIIDATGSTAYSYDQHGRLILQSEQGSGAAYTTAYAYDAQGRLNSLTYPSGRTINYSFDSQGRIAQLATSYNGNTQVLASNISYRPFGGIQRFTYGDGSTAPVQTYTRQYDQDGRIASYTLNGKPLSIGYDAASQIAFIADPANPANTANYNYDAMSRLTGYTQGASNQGYTYDPDGNRISQLIGSSQTSYGYGPGNQLASIQSGQGSPQPVSHDANGATTADPTRQYNYDVRGRLIQTTTAQGAINYAINALGLRVRKQVPYANTDTGYHYDAAGHLIGEGPTGSSQFSREYIYLGDLPVAVMQ